MKLRTLFISIVGYFVLSSIAIYLFWLLLTVGGIQSLDFFGVVFSKVSTPFFIYAFAQSWLALRAYLRPTPGVRFNDQSVRRLWATICFLAVLAIVLYLSLRQILPSDTIKYLYIWYGESLTV